MPSHIWEAQALVCSRASFEAPWSNEANAYISQCEWRGCWSGPATGKWKWAVAALRLYLPKTLQNWTTMGSVGERGLRRVMGTPVLEALLRRSKIPWNWFKLQPTSAWFVSPAYQCALSNGSVTLGQNFCICDFYMGLEGWLPKWGTSSVS